MLVGVDDERLQGLVYTFLPVYQSGLTQQWALLTVTNNTTVCFFFALFFFKNDTAWEVNDTISRKALHPISVGGMAPVAGTTTGDGVRPATSLDTRLRLLTTSLHPSQIVSVGLNFMNAEEGGGRGMREGESKHFLTHPRL